ncbi:MAG TPA: Hsp20/alpha crystallin family protein [Verrucomicrobiae bacterium]|nr:Hsp20/alpha crystallin family protein [Verrucomicrobiae bacterium]
MKLTKHVKNQPEMLSPVSSDWPHLWPWSRLQHQIDQLFEESFERWFEPAKIPVESWVPLVDVTEQRDFLIITVELPGLKREEVEVYLAGDSLNITGERKRELKPPGETHRSERYFGRFHRCIPLPAAVQPNKIEAQFRDGVLTVKCPKTEEAKRKEIEIKVA